MVKLVKTVAFLIVSLFCSICCPAAFADQTRALIVPEGYVAQKLEPFSGSIAKPKDWYFSSERIGRNQVIILSKENHPAQRGFYDTGMKIQVINGVSKKVKDNIVQSFNSDTERRKLIRSCEPVHELNYEKTCIEAIEQSKNTQGELVPYHVMYSFMWLEDYDVLVLSIFGTPKDNWQNVVDVLDVMSHFSLTKINTVAESPKYAAKVAKLDSVIFLQPDEVMQERITDVRILSNYINTLNKAVDEVALASSDKTPASGYVAIALRAGKINVWTDFAPKLPKQLSAGIKHSIQQQQSFNPNGGTVVFALKYNLWDAKPSDHPLSPVEWQQATKDKGEVEISELVDLFW